MTTTADVPVRRLWDNEPLAIMVCAWSRANRINPYALPENPRPVIVGDRIEYLSVCEDDSDVHTVDAEDHIPLAKADPDNPETAQLFPKSTPLLAQPDAAVAEWLRTGVV